jgi:hypothetical protein
MALPQVGDARTLAARDHAVLPLAAETIFCFACAGARKRQVPLTDASIKEAFTNAITPAVESVDSRARLS